MTVLVGQQRDLSTNTDQQRDLSANGLAPRWFGGLPIKTKDRFNYGTESDAAALNMTQSTLSAIHCKVAQRNRLQNLAILKSNAQFARVTGDVTRVGWKQTPSPDWEVNKRGRRRDQGLSQKRTPDVEMAEKGLFWFGWGGADVSPISPHLRKPTPPQPSLGIEQPNTNAPSLDINMNSSKPVFQCQTQVWVEMITLHCIFFAWLIQKQPFGLSVFFKCYLINNYNIRHLHTSLNLSSKERCPEKYTFASVDFEGLNISCPI